MKILFQICTVMYLNCLASSYRHYGFNNSPKRFSGSNFPSSRDYVDHGKIQRKLIRGANDLLNSYFKIGSFPVPYGGGASSEVRVRALLQPQSQVPQPKTSKPATNIKKIRKLPWAEKPQRESNAQMTREAMPMSPPPNSKEWSAKVKGVRQKPVKRPMVIIGPMRGSRIRKSPDWALAAVLRFIVEPTDEP